MRCKPEIGIRFLPLLFFLFSGLFLALGYAQTPAATANDDKAAQLAAGKKLFMEKCGKCHDERGDKPLPSGPPLNERTLTREEITRAVSGRLRGKTDDERAAVVAYIESLLKNKPPPVVELRGKTLPPFG